MSEALERLIEAVEASEVRPYVIEELALDAWPREALPDGARRWDVVSSIAKAFDGSLDAAKALHDALLPGWRWLVEGEGNASVYPPDENLLNAIDVNGAPNPARAWLLAILKAKLAEVEA